MRLNVRTDDRGRLVATVSSRTGPRIAGTAVGAGTGVLGAVLVVSSLSGVGRWWVVPMGLAMVLASSAIVALANRIDRWVFDGGSRRVERHRAALVPLEPAAWLLDDVLEVQVETAPDTEGDAFPILSMRLRSGERVAMFGDWVPTDRLEPMGMAAARINEFLGALR